MGLMTPEQRDRRRGGAAGRPASTLLLALLGLLGWLPSCRSLPDVDFNPLIRIEQREDGSTEIEALGPLIAVRSGPEGLSHTLRPLYQHKAHGDRSVTDFLAPLGRHFEVGDGSRWRLWPLIWSGETRRGPRGSRWNAMLFPIIFAGLGPEPNDSYLAVFPLAGRTHDIFGIDTFDFFLWPLFMRTHTAVSEPSDSWTVLLLGGWTTGGPRDGSWRALPFYRHRLNRDTRGRLRTDQRTVLWPFFTWGRDQLDTAAPSQRWSVWPLASYEASERWTRVSWIWPFFRVNREADPPPSEGGDFLYELPWPLFHWSREDDTSHLWVLPFFSHYDSPTLHSRAFLLPFMWWRHSRGRTLELGGWPATAYERSETYVLPFLHSSRRTLEGRQGDDTEFQFWPVFHSDSGASGREDQAFPSLLPLRNLEFMRPADELYSPFWTLWRHRSDGSLSETRLLFDTTLVRHEALGLRVSVPFLYSRRPERDGVAHHALLWGLLGARTDAVGWRSFSVLGFDVWTR